MDKFLVGYKPVELGPVAPGHLSFITFNVNSIRNWNRKEEAKGGGLKQFLDRCGADFVCMQETKMNEKTLNDWENNPKTVSFKRVEGWRSFWCFNNQKAGVHGTVTFVRRGCVQQTLDLAHPLPTTLTEEGRTVATRFQSPIGPVTLLNFYFPNVHMGQHRVVYKKTFIAEVRHYCARLRRHGDEVILTGDLNAVLTPDDTAQPHLFGAGNLDDESAPHCFKPFERQWIEELCSNRTLSTADDVNSYVDAFRWLYPLNTAPASPLCFTFYETEVKRSSKIGWRLDYFLVSRTLAPLITRCEVLQQYWNSDHVPLLLTLNFDNHTSTPVTAATSNPTAATATKREQQKSVDPPPPLPPPSASSLVLELHDDRGNEDNDNSQPEKKQKTDQLQ